MIEKGYTYIGVIRPTHRDFNEDVKALHGMDATPAEEHPQLEVCGEVFTQIANRMQTTKADCSLKGLRILFEQIPIHLHAGRFDAADHCLESMAVSLLLAQKQYRHMEQAVPSGQFVTELQNGFKPYQNKGKFQSRIEDIKQELIRIDSKHGVTTVQEKEQLMESYKSLALSCAKALIITEVERQKQEQCVDQNMSLSM